MKKDAKATGEVFPTVAAAARYASVSRPTLSKHLHEIPHRVAGRRILITKTALIRWLEGHNHP